MLVTPIPIVTDFKPVQPENAEFPILVTLFEIFIDTKLEQSWNKPFDIVVNPLGK